MEEKSYQEIRKDLLEKYKNDVLPKLAEYEKKRQKLIKSIEKTKIILIILGLLVFIGFFILPVVGGIFFGPDFTALCCTVTKISFFILLIYFIINSFIYTAAYYSFQNNVKSFTMPLVCSCFPNLRWVPDKYYSSEYYKKTKIIPYFSSLFFDDCFEGEYKGVKFAIEELCAMVEESKNSRIVFSGIIIRFKINKKFKGHTIIRPDKSACSSLSKQLHHTEMEDVVFEKKYDVYTNDDVEARYLITPTLMERLNNIKLKFNADKIYVSFYCGEFLLGLDVRAKNFFDYGSLSDSMTDPNPFIKMTEEIILLLKLIDYFKLDQNIGM